MIRLRRPYTLAVLVKDHFFCADDALLAEFAVSARPRAQHSELMTWRVHGREHALALFPYPTNGRSITPPIEGLPVKPRAGADFKSDDEKFAHEALARMNQVVSRIKELEEALDDPENVWSRLQEAWEAAANEQNPRMAEIVKQARLLLPLLQELERRLRRVLRRDRERIALDRVQEMDRASMLWLARQPGRNVAERAGPSQRIFSIARRENFDTLENRVLHAYTRLAAATAREWILEHRRARTTQRYKMVETYYQHCRRFANDLADLGIGVAEPGVTPNYVLLDDKRYRTVREAWLRLHKRTAIEDELWAWQAESWTDFCALAVILSLHRMDEAVLVAQSPILWHSEMTTGRWFSQENPLATFWLRETGLVVEVQARPRGVSSRQAATRAVLWLRVTDLTLGSARRIAVWTPHAMNRADPLEEADLAAKHLVAVQRISNDIALREGLVMLPAHGDPSEASVEAGNCVAQVIALDAAGASLGAGLQATARFVREVLGGASA